MIYPVVQFLKGIGSASRQALSIKGKLQTDIKDPVLLAATFPYKVNCFTCSHDFLSEFFAQKAGNHDIVKCVLLRPKLIVWYIRILIYKELSEGVIDLSLNHPGLDHCKNWS